MAWRKAPKPADTRRACPTCNGSGWVRDYVKSRNGEWTKEEKRCPGCRGTGGSR